MTILLLLFFPLSVVVPTSFICLNYCPSNTNVHSMLTAETQCRHVGDVPKNVNNENNNLDSDD